jgi:hypothetical protein
MRCGACKYWSDRQAQATGRGIEARCLHWGTHHRGAWMLGHWGCEWGEAGESIDLDTPIEPPITQDKAARLAAVSRARKDRRVRDTPAPDLVQDRSLRTG